jgi:hypothetical protein
MKWRTSLVLFAIVLGGCAGADVDGDLAQGAYTITLPTDGIEWRSWLRADAADTANDLCPSGWVLRSDLDLPSDVIWQISCKKPVAVR